MQLKLIICWNNKELLKLPLFVLWPYARLDNIQPFHLGTTSIQFFCHQCIPRTECFWEKPSNLVTKGAFRIQLFIISVILFIIFWKHPFIFSVCIHMARWLILKLERVLPIWFKWESCQSLTEEWASEAWVLINRQWAHEKVIRLTDRQLALVGRKKRH